MTNYSIFNEDAWKGIKRFKDNYFDLILTDPLYDDTMNMDELRRVCKGHIIMFCAPGKPFFKPDSYAYWVKTPSTKNWTKNLGNFVEWIIIEKHGKTFNHKAMHWSNYTGVYYDMIESTPIHPYQKPLSLLKRIITIFSNYGDVILDPFFGSGSTIEAGTSLGRFVYGFERDKNYFNKAKSNLEEE